MNEVVDIEDTRDVRGQTLPHSIEAEQAVLGGLMIANEGFDGVAAIVAENDFYSHDHRVIFAAMRQLSEQEKPLDPVTLSELLDTNQELDQVGGMVYLADIAANTPSSANVAAYAQIVLERSIVRQLINASSDIVKRGYQPSGWDSSRLLAEAERKLNEIIESRPSEGGFENVDSLLKDAIDKLEELFNSDSDITGLATGFRKLNDITSGLQTSDLIIVAGRPSMGKTTVAMNMVEHAVLHQERPVLVFSLEMPASHLMTRILSSTGKIDSKKMRDGQLSEDDWPRLSNAAKRLKGRPLFIDDTPGITPIQMRNRIRELTRSQREAVKKQHANWDGDKLDKECNPALIMVDYIQLMSGSVPAESRTQEVSQISRELKGIAREFKCPVIALSQLSRNVEQRPNKRPVNSDLRESGAIEQDADIIMFVYRDEVYNEDSPDKGIGELIIGKHRNGELGTVRLAFLGKYTRFEDLAEDYFSADEY
ncbi:replicative DNA helicase [bacterium SCSIO 12696]|nr:replicative DNA helicase [bacterium SCSIO 12696]